MEHSSERQVLVEMQAYIERRRIRRLRELIEAGRNGNGYLGWSTYTTDREAGYRRRAR